MHEQNMHTGGSVLPLYLDGQDRARLAMAIYFLNKDVEQLLQVQLCGWECGCG
jgi:hypothetical protein